MKLFPTSFRVFIHFLDALKLFSFPLKDLQLFVALFRCEFLKGNEWTWWDTDGRMFSTLLEFFFFLSSSLLCLNLIEIVHNVSPTLTMKTVTTEKNFEPTRTTGDVLPWVIETPAFGEAYSYTVRINGTELDATNWWWPWDGFVNSTKNK